MKRIFAIALACVLLVFATPSHAGCVDGQDQGYRCSHVDLVERMSPEQLGGASDERLNDIWGWRDEATGDEYVLVGMERGTAFVRISNPLIFLGRLPTTSLLTTASASWSKTERDIQCHDDCGGEGSIWRDIKTYGNYALIVSEEISHGMQVFDLTRLRAATAPQEWSVDAHYRNIGSAHNLAVNEALSRAYIAGSAPGGVEVVDISDPMQPAFLSRFDEQHYAHDLHCVAYAGPDPDISPGTDVCLASNANSVSLWALSDPKNPVELSRITYDNIAYAHQAWFSEDQKYAYVNDELDEIHYTGAPRTIILDVSDLNAPRVAAEYKGPMHSIDHNNYVSGRFLYQSNYTAGLRVVDIAVPDRPVEAGYFDTQALAGLEFSGSWSNYPWLSNGLIAVSDIFDGLFLLRTALDSTTLNADLETRIASSAATHEPGMVDLTVSVHNKGNVDLNDVTVSVLVPSWALFADNDEYPLPVECRGEFENVAECRFAQLAVNEVREVTVHAYMNRTGTAEVFASAYPGSVDATPGDNREEMLITLEKASQPPADEPPAEEPPADEPPADQPADEPAEDPATEEPVVLSGGGAFDFFLLAVGLLCGMRARMR